MLFSRLRLALSNASIHHIKIIESGVGDFNTRGRCREGKLCQYGKRNIEGNTEHIFGFSNKHNTVVA